ncbi:hypothetical protein [Streptomyces vilmorinianum]|uniref:hypothetical protein n=1 Tax=Streptomyces vilmorinianum TaxID=3051092 RepID=UPI0010FB7663|nr:hypothetical protein [Streptomyces vilmorinianum]
MRCFTKVSHDVVRHPRLTSDAKILIIYIQGLPESASAKPLGEHAADLGMKPRAYQKAKEALVACGFLHEWKWQGGRGRWITEQLISNVTLTREAASAVKDGVPPPSPPKPTVGPPAPPKFGGSPPEHEDGEKNTPHPPPETPKVPETPKAPETPQVPEVAEAERLLLSLRHTNRDLLLGVREARGLAEAAAEWLRRGIPVADLRHALTSHLPPGGVRSAVGFLRHRLVEKLPVPAPPPPTAAPAPAAMVTCDGPGDEHLFRPVADETRCRPCRTHDAARRQPPNRPPRTPWRTLVDQLAEGP